METRDDFFKLLKETFEGPEPTGPSAFLDKGTGLFQTLSNVSAEMASTPARPEGSTIAAHTEHVRFYVGVHYKLMLGARDKTNWDDSWLIKTVNSEEWQELKSKLHRAYSTVVEYLRARDQWNEDEAGLTMAVITHTAFHLGAIRQLLLAVKS
jgi:hypothetical protein